MSKDNEGKKLVPQLRFKGFTDPWEQRKLGDIATFLNGRAYKQSELLDAGRYPVLRVGNFGTNTQWYYSNLELDSKFYADNGDLLYTWATAFGPHIWNGSKVIYHYHIWKVELSKQLYRDYALQLFEADKTQLLANTNGSTMTHIKKVDMESKVVSLPKVAEQSTIGIFLNQLDSLITAQERKVDLLKKKKTYYLQQIFSQKLRFKGFTTPWEQRKLGELEDMHLLKLHRGQIISARDMANSPGPYPVYSSSAKNNGKLGEYGAYMFDSELITWSIDGGGSVFYRRKHKFSVTNVCGYISINSGFSYPFLAYEMQRIHDRTHFDYTTKAHPSVLRGLDVINYPAIDEQTKIGRSLLNLDSLITAQDQKLDLLKQLKKAYLAKLFV